MLYFCMWLTQIFFLLCSAGEDYRALSNTMVVLSPADLEDKTVELSILNDEVVEGQEVLMVVVAAESEENIVILERTAYVYIISDDGRICCDLQLAIDCDHS